MNNQKNNDTPKSAPSRRSCKGLLLFCRLLLAATLIFSGFVKAIDPLGTQYKMGEYLVALGLADIFPATTLLVAAVLLSTLEFTLGVLLLFAIMRRVVTKITVALMAAMTLISLWIVVSNPVSDCGCFGDAIHLTNWQTFLKNILLLAAALFAAFNAIKMRRIISKRSQWIVSNYSVLFSIGLSLYCLYALPLFDFRPYRVGNNIGQLMEIPADAPQPEYETRFIMEKNGERRTFTLEDYPDSTWTFIDRQTRQIREGYVAPIHDFSIIDTENQEDLTQQVLGHEGYTFLLIAPLLESASINEFGEIDDLYEYAHNHEMPFLCLTASGDEGIAQWINTTGAEYPICNTDETTLRTMIRSNPGLMLLKQGTILGKWSHNQLPDLDRMSQIISKAEQGEHLQTNTAQRLLLIVLWFILPLALLKLADHLWKWTAWFQRKRHKHQPHIQTNKTLTTMRKKIVAGNWKMNLNLQEGLSLAKELNEVLKADKPNCGVIICTPFIHLASVAQAIDKSVLELGAENCADKEKGAYTGEVSAEMVKSTGADYVILGHSERRGYYAETPEILKEKVLLALKNNLKVIFCIGESLEEREAEKQNEVVKAELEGSVFNLSEEDFRKIIIAYEPIWAIGTGKTATAEQAEEIHAYIRSIIAERYGKAVADDTTILYGGSCKASNAPELFAKPDIDGGLIGGASLKVADFKGIIDAWK